MRCEKFSNHLNLAKWLRTMLSRPRTLEEMVEATGMHYETLRQTVNTLHAEGVLHVATWREDTLGRQTIAVWALGFEQDAKRRKAKTASQRARKHKQKVRGVEEVDMPQIGGQLVANGAIDAALRGWGVGA